MKKKKGVEGGRGGASSPLGHAFQLEASPPQSWLRMFMLEKKVKIQRSQKANVQSHVRRARTAVSGIVGAYAGSGTEVLSKPSYKRKGPLHRPKHPSELSDVSMALPVPSQ